MAGVSKNKINPMLNLAELARVTGYNDTTLRKWISWDGFPIHKEKDGDRYLIHEVFRWRVEYEMKKAKALKKPSLKGEKAEVSNDMQVILMEKERQTYRKLKIKNDVDEGLLTTVEEERKKGFDIGRVLNESLTRIATLKSHNLRKCKSDKATENLLIEYFQETYLDIEKELFEEDANV